MSTQLIENAKRQKQGIPHEQIAVAAYYIWRAEGCPDGRDVAHWYMAIENLERASARSPQREIQCTLSNSLGFTQNSIWTNTHGHTGRSVRGGETLDFAGEWANLSTTEEMFKHEGATELLDILDKLTPLSGRPLPLFRGRDFDDGDAPKSCDMGPPPSEFVKGGRYNSQGQSVLYLSDSEDGVRREQDAWHARGTPFVQRYQLPLDKLRIADFTKAPPDHFVTAVFSKAEECNVAGRGPDNYRFSQAVASIVSQRFDGMRVLGTRGKPTLKSNGEKAVWYVNVVVFRPDRWKEWLGSGPTVLA